LLCLPPTVLAQPAGGNPAGFDRTIAPLLARRCLDCHSGPAPKGKLDLTTRRTALKGGKHGQALVPGNPEKSLLWERVQQGAMPPKKALPDDEKKLLRDWIAGGAGWGSDPIDPFRFSTDTRAGYDWWSLQPVSRPAVPPVKDSRWPRGAIDHFVQARLEEAGLKPSPPADRRTLIRRLSFDLIGLPPPRQEIEAFVRDESPDAYERLVDKLLASPHYGERWARHWLDLARFGESNGFEHDELRKNAWPYRDWVVSALNADMAYDQFARLQLAGDVLLPLEPAAVAATGFLVAGGFDTVGQAQQSAGMKAIVRQDELEDITSVVGQTFLGLTVHCARCHDHKFDPVRQSEYYRLTAALAGVRHGERDITRPSDRADHEKKLDPIRLQLKARAAELEALAQPVRKQILAERKRPGKQAASRPRPLARWDFARALLEFPLVGGFRVEGDARLSRAGLVLSGKTGFAATDALTRDLKARTLAVRVRLSDLQQRGGAAISLQTLDGNVFDAIVFGERFPGRWMAGSEGFVRTRDFGGPPESEATRRPVHLAITYAEDGTITAYRDGKSYGRPYKSSGLVTFKAGQAQVLFGLRHAPAEPRRMLAGTILEAELFDRALSAAEVGAVASVAAEDVAEEEILARLEPARGVRYRQLLADLDRLQARLGERPAAVHAYAVTPRPAEPTYLLYRGNPAQKGPLVTPGGVAGLAGLSADFGLPADAPDGIRRTRLAAWVADSRNPLFARVMVNRLWHHHFGVGLVDTPSDLGFNGSRPSHPELLDWLASEFVRRGFGLKEMHRLIVTSAAYRQSSRFRAEAARKDAGNRLMWRKEPLRLEAEAARDAVLSVAGALNCKMAGPGFQDFTVAVRGATYYYTPVDPDGPEYQRRSLYRTWARSGRSGLLDVLDCPDPSAITPRRAVTTTPLQALTLLNSSFMLRMAEAFAKRVQAHAGADLAGQIRLAYEQAYGRPPASGEMALARRIVVEHGLTVLCRALFNSSEFLYLD
jgi:hypothetical protein